MTGMAILSAVIVVLTVVCTFIRFGPFSITLALTPIIVGAAKYGKRAGAFFGALFGAIVLLTGIFGWDGGFVMLLMSISSIGTVLICIVKGMAAGFVAAVLYKLLAKKNETLGVLLASIACPIVNTGLFVVGMMIFFMPTLTAMAAGESMSLVAYILFGLAGWNFIVELLTNLVLSSATARIIRISKKM